MRVPTKSLAALGMLNSATPQARGPNWHMSGHSKWNTIKRQKEATDKKRGQLFTKLIRAISVAAREGGTDPNANARLRVAIERARSLNVPKVNIAHALERQAESALESFAVDAVGSGGAAMIIDGITDNKNRTLSEIRTLLNQHGAKVAQEGAARWAFARTGIVTIEKTASLSLDDIVLKLIAVGIEDIESDTEDITAYVLPDKLEAVKTALRSEPFVIADVALGWVPKQKISLSPEHRDSLQRLRETLEDHPDIQDVWTNEE